jgi:redox-sensitive bicupin YhaK (pirin superfamily)
VENSLGKRYFHGNVFDLYDRGFVLAHLRPYDQRLASYPGQRLHLNFLFGHCCHEDKVFAGEGTMNTSENLELILMPSSKDLGGFKVHRVLPSIQRQMVGPFIFFDQMGPAQFERGHGIDVRPHPHIGLATVTYLFSGSIMHRDSLGFEQNITPGDVNLMTAGRGIVHSERTAADLRKNPSELYGIQTWLALPSRREEIDPRFEHTPSADLPVFEDPGIRGRVICGNIFGCESPVKTESPTFYVDLQLQKNSSLQLNAEYEERAVFILRGELLLEGQKYQTSQMLVLKPGKSLELRAGEEGVHMMLLGGDSLEGPRYIHWNFVSSRRDRIEQAKEEWVAGAFPKVPGDPEFIPLPT